MAQPEFDNGGFPLLLHLRFPIRALLFFLSLPLVKGVRVLTL
jgi:hypothetical protein